MRKFQMMVAMVLLTGTLFAQSDKEQIKNVINDAYVEGIKNLGAISDIEKGFHPSFELIGMGKDGSTVWESHIYTWLERVKQQKKEHPHGNQNPVSCEFEFIDITGNAAVAKIKLFRGSELVFTDYLNLYKFNEGWRIVSKTFYKHS